MNTQRLEYVGFWARSGAAVIDILIQLAITSPLTYAIYGRTSSPGFYFMGMADLMVNLILPTVAVIALWMLFGATPGKMAMSAKIVDADTGEPLGVGMSIIRYLGYFVAMLPFLVGFFWIGFDRRK